MDTCSRKCEGPAAEAGEEVALPVAAKFSWKDVTDVPAIDDAIGDELCTDQVLQPVATVVVDLIVEIHAQDILLSEAGPPLAGEGVILCMSHRR